MQQKTNIQSVIALLEMSHTWAPILTKATSVKEAQKNLDKFKSEVSKQKKKLMLKYHPDHNPNNSEAEERAKQINNVCELISKMGVIQVRRPQPVQVRVYAHYFSGGMADSTTTSSTWY